MTTEARRVADELVLIIDLIDEHGIQISDKTRQRLIDAADTLGWLGDQADWRAVEVVAGDIEPSPTTPEPTSAEADYRERIALVEQCLDEAHKEHHPPVVRAESMMEAQVQATLALAAATLMAREQVPDRGVAEVLAASAMRAAAVT
jgi:hypothetical protein